MEEGIIFAAKAPRRIRHTRKKNQKTKEYVVLAMILTIPTFW